MSIRNTVEMAKARQEERFKKKHEKEAEARPDPMHRAVLFLLQQAIQNNRDCKTDADYHIGELDAAYGKPEKIEELHKTPEPSPVELAAENAGAPDQPPTEEKPNPVATMRRSRRFSGRT